jgi:DNA repair photolyase
MVYRKSFSAEENRAILAEVQARRRARWLAGDREGCEGECPFCYASNCTRHHDPTSDFWRPVPAIVDEPLPADCEVAIGTIDSATGRWTALVVVVPEGK